MRALFLLAAAPLALTSPALAQHAGHVAPSKAHAGHDMGGMDADGADKASTGKTGAGKTGQTPPADPHAGHAMPATTQEGDGPPRATDPDTRHDMAGMKMDDTAPAAVDVHTGHDMSGMSMNHATPAPARHDMGGTTGNGATGDPHAGHDMAAMAQDGAATDPHAGHDMGAMKRDGGNDGMAGMDHAAMGHGAAPAAGEVGDAPAPAPPADRWADRYYPTAEMDAARAITRAEHGGGTYSQIMFNLAEVQVRKGREGYRWDGEGWFGGDIDRLTIKTEGEASFGRPSSRNVEAAEAQALWSHAIDAYWNLQSGVRVDVQPGPSRAYATLGFEGLAPYWFEVEGAVFLSDKGDVLGRVEAYYDQRLTQRLVLQPRVELNFAAQDVPENEMGSGLVNAELGLRMRYEITREFAPYVGVSWDRKVGDTARYARADGERASEASFVAGVRFWF